MDNYVKRQELVMSINSKKYAASFGLGVIGGSFLTIWATGAIPKMMSGMMQKMMARMQEEGCDPKEM
jgi:hypothetical protein